LSKSIFVISDLHLGGTQGRQMCSSTGQSMMAEFIRWVGSQRAADKEIHLVIAGDIVDFLAESSEPFTADEDRATRKLQFVFDNTNARIWDGLQDLLKKGCELTLMLGNHDLELSLPKPRALLLKRIGAQHNVRFVYDNEAFVESGILIEHGNRYDSWNVIDHGALRAVRSALSRLEPAPKFTAPSGSQLVVDVMNAIKAKFAFVDLLKPENEILLPLLVALDPGVLTNVLRIANLRWQIIANRRRPDGQPLDESQIAAAETAAERDREMLKLCTGGIDVAQVGAFEDMKAAIANIGSSVVSSLTGTLHTALRTWAGNADQRCFDETVESNDYLAPANEAAKRGFRYVVYGHTHLVKHVPLAKGAMYLNTGTWADLMGLPRAILSEDAVAAKAQLDSFIEDIKSNQLTEWRRTIPTFARLDIERDRVMEGDVYFFNMDGSATRVEDGQLAARLHEPVQTKTAGGAGGN